MNSLKIERDGSDLVVHIDAPAASVQGVYDAVKDCRRTGVWSCPSGECVHIERCDVQRQGEQVLLRLTPPPGATLSVAGIDECLRYVIGKPGAPTDGK